MSLGPSGFEDVRYLPDGNLVSEFLYMERLWRQGAVSNDYEDYTCGVRDAPMLECLDIAGLRTLTSSNLGSLSADTGAIDRYPDESIYDPDTNIFINLITGGYNSSVSSAFGDYNDCNDGSSGITGDGQVGAYDISALLWYQFRAPPYDRLSRIPSLVRTTVGRVGTSARCNFTGEYGQHDRQEWMALVSEDYCVSGYLLSTRTSPPAPPPPPSTPPSGGRRLLTAGPAAGGSTTTGWAASKQYLSSTSQVSFVNNRVKGALDQTGKIYDNIALDTVMQVDYGIWSETTNGAWYKIAIVGVQTAFEMFMSDLMCEEIQFSSQSPPPENCTHSCEPFSDLPPLAEPTTKGQIRFKRRMEYLYEETGDPAIGAALAKCATIEPGFSGGLGGYHSTFSLRQTPSIDACAFDIYLWVPKDEERRDPCVLGGTNSQGTDYYFLNRDVCIEDTFLDPEDPTSPSSDKGGGLSTGAIVGIAVGGAVLLCCCWCCCWLASMRRKKCKRNEEEEECAERREREGSTVYGKARMYAEDVVRGFTVPPSRRDFANRI